MTVSVAMATYNGGRFLQEQLDSIRRQTRLPDELVVCDDGSTDDTVDILRRFAADAPFKVVIDAHGQHLGFTPNFLRAIGQCAGEIVALCDQDDVWDERKLAVCVLPFAEPAVMAVSHPAPIVDEQLRPSGMVHPPGSWHGKYTLFNLDPWYSPNGMQLLFRRAPIIPWLSGTPPLTLFSWFVTETFDEWIYHTALLLGTAVILKDHLGVWRRHGATVTNNLDRLAETHTATHSLQYALRMGITEPYEFRARLADSRAEFAGRGATVPGAVEYFRRMAQTFRRRVCLHDPRTGRLRRLQTFVTMAARNDYRSRARGGLGAKAVLKDGYTIFFGPRVSGGSS